jgi:hypothetical protein
LLFLFAGCQSGPSLKGRPHARKRGANAALSIIFEHNLFRCRAQWRCGPRFTGTASLDRCLKTQSKHFLSKLEARVSGKMTSNGGFT